ncbi:MAG TPA: glucokinase [Deltaproteobacteria bacterium]|nr:glucokinase [Deltaproteobacteria bacterium]
MLAGDIGGTKTNLGVFELGGAGPVPVEERRYSNGEYAGFEDLLARFLADAARGIEFTACAFGVAATVEDRSRCRLVNIDWAIDGEALSRRFGLGPVALLNDLAATAWGLEGLGEDDLEPLQKAPAREGNAALIAAGTGLGEAILFRHGSRLIPSASEGGHCDFAPRDETETELLAYLKGRFGHVSYERVVSGPGLKNIYDFLRTVEGLDEPEELARRLAGEDPPSVIADEAIRGVHPICVEALRIFVSVYGAEAGNLALKSLATGGLYVGGGIAPRIIEALRNGPFIEAFTDKGRFRDVLSRIPVHVVMNPKTALLGAARYCSAGLEAAFL